MSRCKLSQHLEHTASLCDLVEKLNIKQDMEKTIVNLQKSASSLCSISRCLQGHLEIISPNKYKQYGNFMKGDQ